MHAHHTHTYCTLTGFDQVREINTKARTIHTYILCIHTLSCTDLVVVDHWRGSVSHRDDGLGDGMKLVFRYYYFLITS